MKKDLHKILKDIYRYDDLGVRELSEKIPRKHKDHRDFYGLVALIDAGYIGFTGPTYKIDDGQIDAYKQTRLFQAYSQGYGDQAYDGVSVSKANNKEHDSFLYIGPKSIEYFQKKSEFRKGFIITAIFGLIVAVASAFIVAKLSGSETCCTEKKHLTSCLNIVLAPKKAASTILANAHFLAERYMAEGNVA